MKIILLCDNGQQEELTAQGLNPSIEMVRVNDPVSLTALKADVCIDLLFDSITDRIKRLSALQTNLVIVNSVLHTLDELPAGFIRINGWNSFLKRSVIEAAGPEDLKENARYLFSLFNKKIEWTADVPGFISARVVVSIINEAYFALQEQVSTKEEIDTAMKLGTNYPYGPFEWSRKIGLKNVYSLLTCLSQEQKRYLPAALLREEANN